MVRLQLKHELQKSISAKKESSQTKSNKGNKTKMRKCCGKTGALKVKAAHMNVSKRQRTKQMELSTCLTETHPFSPFVRPHTEVILCGSFLPVRREMDFYYPNTTNDMWRILGAIFFKDCNYFYSFDAHEDGKGHTRKMKSQKKCFKFEKIMTFMESAPIGFCDVAKVIKRKCNNASDDNLEIVEEWNIVDDVLINAPNCKALVATGTLSCSHLLRQLHLFEHEMLSHDIMNTQSKESHLSNEMNNWSKDDAVLSKNVESQLEEQELLLQKQKGDTEKKSKVLCQGQNKSIHVHDRSLSVNEVAHKTNAMRKKTKLPAIGEAVTCYYYRKEKELDKLQTVAVVRAPSTSRAYPLQFVKKLSVYEQIVKQYCSNNEIVENLIDAINDKLNDSFSLEFIHNAATLFCVEEIDET